MRRFTRFFKCLPALAAILCISVMPAAAQKLTVKNCIKFPNELTQRTDPRPVKDQNGNVCALLKIRTTLKLSDFTFKGERSGIQKVVPKAGEIWVYISPGELYITFHHATLGWVSNYAFDEPLETATVYVMQLQYEGSKEPAMQYLTVYCSVEGALITFDGELGAFKDGKFQKLVAPGRHTFSIDAPLYETYQGTVETKADGPSNITPPLRPAFGAIAITSQPAGAEVYVDDRPKENQTTPLTVDRLKSGTHTVRILKDLYQPVIRQVTVRAIDTTLLDVTLPTNMAIIELIGNGDIYIDSKFAGRDTWSGPLESGNHIVEQHKDGYHTGKEDIVIVAGKNRTIELTPIERMYGTLDIQSTPTATIFIDDVEWGTTPRIIDSVPAGKRRIELRADGYEPYRQDVIILDGRTLPVDVPLQETPKTASLSVSANVRAYVMINGRDAGYTPLKHDNLPVGQSVTIAFTADGYDPLTQTVAITRGGSIVRGELVKAKPTAGSLHVTANTKATIYKGSEKIGLAPVTLNNIPFGKEIEIFAEAYYFDYLDQSKKIILNQDETLAFTLKARYQPTYGGLFVSYIYDSNPVKAGGPMHGVSLFNFKGPWSRVGWYASFRANRSLFEAEPSQPVSSAALNAGPVFNLFKPVSLYIGPGVGYNRYHAAENDPEPGSRTEWFFNPEAGLALNLKYFVLFGGLKYPLPKIDGNRELLYAVGAGVSIGSAYHEREGSLLISYSVDIPAPPHNPPGFIGARFGYLWGDYGETPYGGFYASFHKNSPNSQSEIPELNHVSASAGGIVSLFRPLFFSAGMGGYWEWLEASDKQFYPMPEVGVHVLCYNWLLLSFGRAFPNYQIAPAIYTAGIGIML
ncbi:MAG: PEGA domain-containing protein [Prevotellaceae bacterium]|jgi:hypothetical protein|nr:PEGA domain-containing protein [Prevotellaceae bacterium]